MTCVNRLGELERAIMDVLWDSTEPLTVRQVGLRLINRDLAHTTVMTVLDRLAKTPRLNARASSLATSKRSTRQTR